MKPATFFWLARRALFSRRQKFIPLLTGVSWLGVGLGVFFLLVVLSVMVGFQRELNRRWIGLNAHLTVGRPAQQTPVPSEWQEKISSWKEVAEVERFVTGEVIVQTESGGGETAAAKLQGVERFSPAFRRQMEWEPPDLESWEEAGDLPYPPLAGGELLFSTLGLHPRYPEKIKLVHPLGEIGPLGDFVPKEKTFWPTHAFRSGLYIWDAYTVLVPYTQALQLLGDFKEAGLQIRLRRFADLNKIEARLRETFPQAEVTTFAKQNARLFAALKLERLAMGLLLILFLAVASFSIGGLLLMFLYTQQRDLGLLRALGFSPQQVRRFYWTLGGWIGGLGTLCGAGMGTAAVWILQKYPIRLPATYYLDYLPVVLEWKMLAGVALLGLGLALGAASFPARLAARLDILPQIREE